MTSKKVAITTPAKKAVGPSPDSTQSGAEGGVARTSLILLPFDETEKVALLHVQERPKYANYAEFILSSIGYSVGLGNVWRFPQLAYEFGGGAFLIPYWVAVLVVGLPLYHLELALGQYVSLGPCIVFEKIAPIAQGVGWSMFVISMIIIIYYHMVIAWAVYYFFLSFRSTMLWSTCRNDWNTPYCHSIREDNYCQEQLNDSLAKFYNKTCWAQNVSIEMSLNETKTIKVSPADEFFNNYILNASDGFENMGGLQWPLVGCLTLCWFITIMCVSKGVHSTGKAVYVTTIFPYIILFSLLIRGVTLKGAQNGLYYYLVPNFSKLLKSAPWFKAATQVFYSLNTATGGIITIGSYMEFYNNCKRDALLISVTDTLTSILSGCAIFAILGFMADELGVEVHQVTKSGAGLIFVAYPEAIVRMPWCSMWAVLFFFMVVLLGIGSEFVDMETCITCLLDRMPKLRNHRLKVIFVVSGICYLTGLLFCTRGGIYYFTMFDDYGASYTLMLIAICELCIIGFIYGIDRFAKNIKSMLGHFPSRYWLISWRYTGPIYLTIVLLISFYNYAPSDYGSYVFSPLAQTCGWLLASISVVLLPGFALFNTYEVWAWKQPFKILAQPGLDWKAYSLETALELEASKVVQKYPKLTIKSKSSLDSDTKKTTTQRSSASNTQSPTLISALSDPLVSGSKKTPPAK